MEHCPRHLPAFPPVRRPHSRVASTTTPMTKAGKPDTKPLRPAVLSLATVPPVRRTASVLAGLAVLLAAAGLATTPAAPISECDFLLLLKREALRCGGRVLAYEGAETRLQCAARRALRVTATRGLDPPERSETLIGLFAALDAQVHAGRITPATATRRLETFVGLEDCLERVDEEGPLTSR